MENLHVAIIGAGMAGLSTALALAKAGFKRISVYEVASDLGFVGAGIQMAPNMARILDHLGVWGDIEPEAVDMRATSIRQGSTNAELAHIDLSYVRERYGFPHVVGHRASLAGALYAGCKKHPGIQIHFSTTVEVLSFGPRPKIKVVPRSGKPYEVETDVVIACDGIKSSTRVKLLEVLGVEASVEDSGQASYRIILRREDLQHDPELLALMDSDSATRWIGEKRHIIAYSMSSKQLYNISTSQPDVNFAEAPSATYTTKGSKKQMLKVFSDFCPMIQRMLDFVPEGEVCEWKMRVHAPLPTWVHHQVTLVGDACHPTLPHLAQGAAQAIEDAAVLSVVLSMMPDCSPETINKTLRVYQMLRKERTDTLVALAAASGRRLHLGEGAAREERDKQFAAFMEKQRGEVPDKWADADVQKMINGHDCMQDAREKFTQLFKTLA
ncbi:hypothetical protein CPB85DRAFT_1430296 [Mucidula mucida]|nr:hypothetical protein CPB85DRAFT_1430296 [Mucidula mucida]